MPSIFRRRQMLITRAAQPAPPRTDEDVRQALRLLPRYRVLLFNDDYHTMDHVVVALVRSVPQLGVEDAVRIMLEAHTNGQAVVIICPKETAECYREKLEQHGLTSTIEPD
jgi:ATP-dependent Clp protease adaptor protein ClpS